MLLFQWASVRLSGCKVKDWQSAIDFMGSRLTQNLVSIVEVNHSVIVYDGEDIKTMTSSTY